jgi:c-di-AMP phosphodiesterase-like protein
MSIGKAILSALVVTAIIAFILMLMGKDVEKMLAMAALIVFLLFALLDPPEKHKNFGENDIQQSINQSCAREG